MANPMMTQGPMDAEAGAEQQAEPLKSVTIEQVADGSYLVGTEPSGPDAETAGEADTGMQPAKTIDEALDLARQALQDDAANPNEMWNRVQRDRALSNQPGGPLMGMQR